MKGSVGTCENDSPISTVDLGDGNPHAVVPIQGVVGVFAVVYKPEHSEKTQTYHVVACGMDDAANAVECNAPGRGEIVSVSKCRLMVVAEELGVVRRDGKPVIY